MKAVLMSEPGGPEVLALQEVEAPQITSATQLRVRLRAAGVNPIDTKLRARGHFADPATPAILGCDGAGEVMETGAQVSRFKPGDRVWFCHGGLGHEPGNYAEFQVLEQELARAMPKSLSFAQAAAGPLVLITAWEALFDRGRLETGQTVLIHAGAGGVGHVAIQLAKLKGARVITTVSTKAKADFVHALGADEVILYPETDFVVATLALTQGQGADLVLDTVGPATFASSIRCTAHYGHLVTLLDPGALDLKEARNRNLSLAFTLMLTPMLRNLPKARAHQGWILDQCRAWIDQGRLSLSLSQELPLAQAQQAHRMIESGHSQGKVVLLT